MIKDYEQYHGIALSRIAHKYGKLNISTDFNNDNSSYLLNNEIGLYIKFSKKRLTPWQFSFNADHYQDILKLAENTKSGYLALVCGFDGVCCISFDDFFYLINGIERGTIKSISVARFKNQQYQVTGSDNQLKRKIADSEIDA